MRANRYHATPQALATALGRFRLLEIVPKTRLKKPLAGIFFHYITPYSSQSSYRPFLPCSHPPKTASVLQESTFQPLQSYFRLLQIGSLLVETRSLTLQIHSQTLQIGSQTVIKRYN